VTQRRPFATSKRMGMFTDYLEAAMRHAQYEELEDRSWYARIPDVPGLWVRGANKEEARAELMSALDDWLYVNAYSARVNVPEFDGLSFMRPPRTVEN
jgi:predicted RNase H-like HicB family nuclease